MDKARDEQKEENLPKYLVKGRVDVVGKLDLCNCCGTSNSRTDAESHNPLLTEGRVEDSVLTWGRGGKQLKWLLDEGEQS